MRATALIAVSALAIGCISSRPVTSWSKDQFVTWYGSGTGAVRWVGYQGSDEISHHFVARVMDTFTFVELKKTELQLSDERPFSKASSASLYHYIVDPSRGFQKVES